MKKMLLWIFAITLIVVLNNPQWLSFINLSFIDVEKVVVYSSWVWLVILIVITIIIVLVYDREYEQKESGNEEYNLDPYLLEYINSKCITKKSFTASIYELIMRGVFIPVVDKESDIYIFVLNEDFNIQTLTKQEIELKNFLLHQVGNDEYWTLYNLEQISSSRKKISYFSNIYNNWKDIHTALAVKENVLERKSKNFYNYVLWLTFVGLGLSIFNLMNGFDRYIAFYLLAGCIGFVFYSFTFTRLNREYLNTKFYYKKFKKNMDEIDSFNKYKTNDVNVWEKYLLYSTIFENSDKIEALVKEIVVENNDYFDSDIFILASKNFLTKLVKINKRNISFTKLPLIIYKRKRMIDPLKEEELYKKYKSV